MLQPIFLLMVLIFLNAVFASAEIAVISMSDLKLRQLCEAGDRRAGKLEAFIKQPAKFLATIQVAITLAGFLQSAFAAENFAQPLVTLLRGTGIPVAEEALKSACIVVITLILAYFNLVFGELVPKRVAMKKAEELRVRDIIGSKYPAVRITVTMDALLESAMNQNFIPVIDDLDNFIGIVTRRDIISYLAKENENSFAPPVSKIG